MIEAFIAFLIVMALKQYLGLGDWVWWVFGIGCVVDMIMGLMKAASE